MCKRGPRGDVREDVYDNISSLSKFNEYLFLLFLVDRFAGRSLPLSHAYVRSFVDRSLPLSQAYVRYLFHVLSLLLLLHSSLSSYFLYFINAATSTVYVGINPKYIYFAVQLDEPNNQNA
ncbi:unnamed protein product [Musa acuminata subsp. burmannicoides]